MQQHSALARAAEFCEAFNLRVPILMAPMAGALPGLAGHRNCECGWLGWLRCAAHATGCDQGLGGRYAGGE